MIQTSLPGDPSGRSDRGSGSRVPTSGALPADPSAYDSERNTAARARGLSAPYIAGGRDPDQARADREDRRYLKILLVMVVVIVLAGFVLGGLAALAGLNGLLGNPA